MAASPKNPDDADLIARLLAGDGETVEQVRVWIRGTFKPYRARLAPELEDLEQEILLDLTRALREDRFRRQSRLRTYVRTYVHHKCIDRLRAASRREWVDVEDLDLPSRAPSPFDELSAAETTELALRVVEQMPESCRELWQMLQQGMRYREMSRRLGVAEGTLRARVLRCRRRALELRTELLAQRRRNRS
jgi:RNA polymerase sigma factor (sigma-70 family)